MIKLIEQLGALTVELCGLNNTEISREALCVLLAADSNSI